jgi:hypothetical protein
MSSELTRYTLPPQSRAQLATVVTTSLPEGTLVQATDVTYTYALRKTGLYTADGTLVIAGSGGGYWVATTYAQVPGERFNHYVDGNRTDTYVEDGSVDHPYKTIQAAINAIAALADSANYHVVSITSGVYAENLILENAGLYYVKLQGEGYVSINPSSGNALRSTATNANLNALLVSNIGFAKPVVITGPAATATAFQDVIWEHVKFTGTATLAVTCVNNFSLVNPYSEQNITYQNVAWSYVESGQLQGQFNFTMDDTQPIPSGGNAGTILANGVFQSGAVSYTIGGTATYTVAVQACRWGTTGAITVPAGCTLLGYNSWFRGTHTNNGAITLRNSATEGYTAGTGTLTITGSPGTQIDFQSVTSGAAWVTPPTSMSDAVDRIAAALFAHTAVQF